MLGRDTQTPLNWYKEDNIVFTKPDLKKKWDRFVANMIKINREIAAKELQKYD